ncbi:MAG: TolC family protein, partial [Bacteroidales bacterium]|nr:TolC family protein [Bacteroidales bacterium]
MAQFRTEQRPDSIRIYIPDTLTLDLGENPVSLSLEDAMKIALSENIAVKVADMEIQRSEYAKKGAYAALFPQVDGSASYQRTIRKQVMYMDFDMSEMMGAFPGAGTGDGTGEGDGTDVDPSASGMGGMDTSGGIEVGRWNTYNAGVSAVMPLVNVQLWKSLKISGQDVE